MSRFDRPFRGAAALILAAAAVMVPVTFAAEQDSKSAPVAKELVQALEAAKLENIAAADPADPASFIAALYIPGTQLLVVSAKYSAPPLLADRIKTSDFMGVYVDLQSASVHGSKVFVQDAGADGLRSKPDGDQAADTVEQGDKTVVFDGEPKKAKLSDADYSKAYGDADERYAKMLSTLVAQVKGKKSGS
jgi:hypothetical protein